MKKAEMPAGQIFVYVLTIVIIALVFIYGYNAIATIIEKQKLAALNDFQDSVSNTAETVTNDMYGTVKKRTFTVPGDYRKICFVTNARIPNENHIDPFFPSVPKLLKDSISSNQEDNFFLVEDLSSFQPFIIRNIDTEPNDVVCFEVVNNMVEIKFTSRGNHTLISKP